MGPSPFLPHGAFAATLAYEFQAALRQAKLTAWVLVQEIDWIIDEHTVVRPDLMLISGPATNTHLTVPPVLIVEILSPATQDKDRHAKFQLYQQKGVRDYVIADPNNQSLEVFQLANGRYVPQPNDPSLKFPLNDQVVLELTYHPPQPAPNHRGN